MKPFELFKYISKITLAKKYFSFKVVKNCQSNQYYFEICKVDEKWPNNAYTNTGLLQKILFTTTNIP